MSKVRTLRVVLAALPLLMAFLAMVEAVRARSLADSAVHWQVISGGGAPAVSDSGAAVLNGSLGQTAVGPSVSRGVSLGAGFWYGTGPGQAYPVYLPLVLRNY
jgi:hypothetical protein